MTFREEILEPVLEQATRREAHVFFVDAAHFVLLPFLGFLYSLVVRYIKSTPGRKRWNVLGALNAVTQELITVCNATTISAAEVVTLLQTLYARFTDWPIILIMDNARYQRCKAVIEAAAALHIQLIFLPPYSPNLNLIERLWKFVKKKVLYNQYYATFPKFTQAITHCLEQTATTYREELQSLLTLKFHIPDKEHFIA